MSKPKGSVSGLHPLHAVILERPADAKPGVWIVAGVPVWKTYPCSCRLGRACETEGDFPCRCWGRTDGLAQMPPHCCAGRAARLAAKAATNVQIGASA